MIRATPPPLRIGWELKNSFYFFLSFLYLFNQIPTMGTVTFEPNTHPRTISFANSIYIFSWLGLFRLASSVQIMLFLLNPPVTVQVVSFTHMLDGEP